jgi:succinate dehydrogenase/fumarate reductase-like Fe-S protein
VASAVFVGLPKRMLAATIDGHELSMPEGTTILDACQRLSIDTPTLCNLETLTPVNVCRVCVVEVEGSRVLVPACSRKVEAGMKIQTDSERVRHSRRLVLEMLGSSVDMSLCAPEVQGWMDRYSASPQRFGLAAANVEQPVKVDNELYVRDYSRCILCYKCVEACGVDRVRDAAARIGVRLLRQLHRRLPDGRADVQERVRHAPRGYVGRDEAVGDGDRVPVLRCRVHARAARAGQLNREGHIAARPQRHFRSPVREGPVRIRVRAEAKGVGRCRLSGPTTQRPTGCSRPIRWRC